MAIGETKTGNFNSGTCPVVIQGSATGKWIQANDDARTAQSTAMSYNPSTITDSTFHWVRVPTGVQRVIVQGRVPKATTAVGTSPTVKLVGGYITDTGSDSTDAAAVSAGEVRYVRLDATSMSDAGQTLTFDATPSTSDSVNDSTWFYSLPTGSFDTLGCTFIGVLVTTAGACTASAAMPVDILLLN